MNNNLLRYAIWPLWLALPLTYWRFRESWDELPERMAVHFDIKWQPNGWMARETAFWFMLGLTAFLLVVFTVVAYAMQTATGGRAGGWGFVVVSYATMILIYAVNSYVVQYNITHKP